MGDYSHDRSYAVVNKNLGIPAVNVHQNDAQKVSIDLGGIRLDVLRPATYGSGLSARTG
jgi:hypothetical protein